MAKILSEAEIRFLRARQLATLFQSVDRALEPAQRITVQAVVDSNQLPLSNSIPAYSEGPAIFINALPTVFPELTSNEAMIRFAALNYHELAHVLLTPPLRFFSEAGLTKELHGSWNILEDQRIERQMVRYWHSLRFYFTGICLDLIVERNGKPSDQAHLLTYGRRYLPRVVRDRARKLFVDTYVTGRFNESNKRQSLIDLEAVIDEFRLMQNPIDYDRAVKLVQNFEAHCRYLLGSKSLPNTTHGADSNSVPVSGNGNTQARRPTSTQQEIAEANKGQDKKDAQDQGQGSDAEDKSDGDGSESSDTRDSESDSSDELAAGGRDAEDQEEGGGSGSEHEDADDLEDAEFEGSEQGGLDEMDSQGKPNGSAPSQSDNSVDVDDNTEDVTAQSAGDGTTQGSGKLGEQRSLSDLLKDLGDQNADQANEAFADDLTDLRRILKNGANGHRNVTDKIDGMSPASIKNWSLAKKLSKKIARVVDDADPNWDRGTDTGKLNVQKVLRESPVNEAFDRWDEGQVAATEIEVVVALDMSGSMRMEMEAASEAAYNLRLAFDAHPNISSTFFGFGDKIEVPLLYDPRKKMQKKEFPIFEAPFGTVVEPVLIEAASVFQFSRRRIQLLIIQTDGIWNDTFEAEKMIDRLKKAGVFTALLHLGAPHGFSDHRCHMAKRILHMDALVSFTEELVTNMMRAQLRR